MKHYHVWVPCHGGRGLKMLAVKLTGAAIRRERIRGSRRVVRRWWRSRQAADKALRQSGEQDGFVRECSLEQCPEHAHVVSN